MPGGLDGGGGRVVYITILYTANRLRDFRYRGCTGADAPKEQGKYVKKT